ncbi:MAG: sigma-54-dependent Fis family transcriptional regulator [Nitrospirae bacterium]|nr:sigma-54-dependent Fis family transcriptional regulator [Nitrospirota bacterium]
MKKQILIVEDDPIMRLGMEHFLSSQGYAITLAADGAEGIMALEKGSFDLIITDLRLPHRSGLDVLRKAREACPASGVIIITAFAEIKGSVEAMKEGAFDYIAKPFSNDEFLISIERFFNFRKLEDEVIFLRETLRERVEFGDIIGSSPLMKDVFDRITAVADTDVPVLIRGESGTGKELVANAIHRLSRRNNKAFIKINCAAIPEALFESELFGHMKGAFTGASEMRKGKFEFADEGTIFFDEIGDIPLTLQPKLLRILEDSNVTRIGGNSPIKVNVRSIYATRRNLKECVEAGEFREDLFYRINVVPISLPPLRDRKEDIPHLVDHFLAYFRAKFNKPGLKVSQAAYDTILSYDYPGNVRELKHAVERGAVLGKDDTIQVKDLPDEMSGTSDKTACYAEDLSLEASIRCFEKQRIIRALSDSGGKKTEAAERLGISRKVLWKKIKEIGIE